MNERPYLPGTRWSFTHLWNHHVTDTDLRLYWEVAGNPYSDHYSFDEIAAPELFKMWLDHAGRKRRVGDLPAPGWLPISWFVLGEHGFKPERAPFDPLWPDDKNFLTYFTWPVSVTTGELLNWLGLPVVDKLWRPGREDKGGFIQEATGWKPSPLQPVVHVDHFRAVPLG